MIVIMFTSIYYLFIYYFATTIRTITIKLENECVLVIKFIEVNYQNVSFNIINNEFCLFFSNSFK